MNDFSLPKPVKIVMLDDDHVIRIGRYMLSGPPEVSDDWIRDFLLPEEMNLADVFNLGRGLHKSDGVELIPRSAHPVIGAGDASILVFRRGKIDAEFIAASPNLRLIQRFGGRPSGIDLAAATARGIMVSCLPRPSLQYAAEHAVLLILALFKRLVEADKAVRLATFDLARLRPQNNVCGNWAALPSLGGLFQKKVGLVGVGEIGSLVAAMLRAFGATVLYTNRHRLPPDQEKLLGAEYVSFNELLERADVVSLHANNIPENVSLFGADAFSRMKSTAFFINTSRGALVDEDALFSALSKGTIAGAGLDVHAIEPRPIDRFSALSNVIMTPHTAGGSRKDVIGEIGLICDNCRAFISGQPIKYRMA
jgi:phosphoglycerate dehydrogenase-like enzyme